MHPEPFRSFELRHSLGILVARYFVIPNMRLALIQQHITPGDPTANLARAAAHVATAADNGADIALLPEGELKG